MVELRGPTYLDFFAAALVGAYLISVGVKGNAPALVTLAKKDATFLKWALALALLSWLYQVPALRGPMSFLIAAAFAGFALHNVQTVKANAAKLWNSF